MLLDLLGARHPAIHSHFPRTHHWFLRLVAIGGTQGWGQRGGDRVGMGMGTRGWDGDKGVGSGQGGGMG